MQANWIISSDPEWVMQKLAAGTGLQASGTAAWADLLPGSAPLMLISDYPGKEQERDRREAFIHSMQEFVLGGGCLTALGESASLLPLAFPERVTGTRFIEAGLAAFSVSDPGLANLFGQGFEIEPTEPVEVPGVELEGLRTFVQTDSPDPDPVVFSFDHGDGMVICQPFPLGALEKEDMLLAYLEAFAQTRSLRVSMQEKAHNQRAAVMAEYPLLLSKENPAFTVEFSPPPGKNAMVLLDWEGDARVHLHIEDGQQRMALNHIRESGFFAWYSPMPEGKWYCKAELVETRETIVPALLTCCAINPPARQKHPQGYHPNPGRVQRCPKCKMPLNPAMKFCPACGREVENPAPR